VKVKALFLQFFEAGENGGAVEAGANGDGQQIGLGDARGQHSGYAGALAPESAERVHENGRGDAGGWLLERLGGKFFCPAFVNAAGSGVGTDKIVLKTGLKISLLADFFEKGQPHSWVVDRHVARPEDGATGSGGVG
jgi:hypothetical protein